MDVKSIFRKKDESGWVGARVRVKETGHEGVVTNVLPAADGKEPWSLHVRLVHFPKNEAPEILAPFEVERLDQLN